MTQVEANKIVSTASRCTQATVRAFGIEIDYIPQLGSGTLEAFKQAGFMLNRIRAAENKTLATVKKLYILNSSSYLIFTRNHAMACIKGTLIDTMCQSFNGRKVEFMWEAEKCG